MTTGWLDEQQKSSDCQLLLLFIHLLVDISLSSLFNVLKMTFFSGEIKSLLVAFDSRLSLLSLNAGRRDDIRLNSVYLIIWNLWSKLLINLWCSVLLLTFLTELLIGTFSSPSPYYFFLPELAGVLHGLLLAITWSSCSRYSVSFLFDWLLSYGYASW